MTSVRRRRDRHDVEHTTASATRRRRSSAAPLPPSRMSPSTDAAAQTFAYVAALGEVADALECEAASPSAEATARRQAAQARARDRKHELAKRIGRAAVERIRDELTRDGGLALGAAARAAPAARGYVLQARIDASRIRREHGLEVASAWRQIDRSARWSAHADSMLDRAFAEPDPQVRAELLKLAAMSGREARLDMLAALHVGRERRVIEAPTIDVVGALRAFEAEQAREGTAEEEGIEASDDVAALGAPPSKDVFGTSSADGARSRNVPRSSSLPRPVMPGAPSSERVSGQSSAGAARLRVSFQTSPSDAHPPAGRDLEARPRVDAVDPPAPRRAAEDASAGQPRPLRGGAAGVLPIAPGRGGLSS